MKRTALYILLALQVAGLAATYAFYASGLAYPSVLLEAHRIDPRDLLRGDYVILSYGISAIPPAAASALPASGVAYVVLEEKDGFHVVSDVRTARPEGDAAAVPWMKARIDNGRLLYDMERYYVPEGMGNPQGDFTVEAAIRPDGSPQIKKFLVDGEAWP